ncbi:MAG: hypothetical protein ACK4SZ_16235 [Allosphingosinicella sp.]|uniref:hypothetical protein n=1 Tax=Allosphingosinicella sp. TaxID=2823234 RepID=UPI00391FE215
MSARPIEELDSRPLPTGKLSLRRHGASTTADDVYEVQLDDHLLMSTRWNVGAGPLVERALGHFGEQEIDIVLGGLGLGLTAKAVLDLSNVRSLIVVEPIPELIEWHEAHLIPAGKPLTEDPRCRFVSGDFFDMAAPGGCFDIDDRGRRYDAIIVDMDRSPRHLLYALNNFFYGIDGLLAISDKLTDDGVLALAWTDEPDPEFIQRLEIIFGHVEAEPVLLDSSHDDAHSVNTIYVARRRDPSI